MLLSYPEEALLELVHLDKICFHMWIPGLVRFVGEVDDELRIPFDDDVLDSERNGGLEAADEPVILRDVVGDLAAGAKTELNCVAELVTCGRGLDDAGASATTPAGAVEVYRPDVGGALPGSIDDSSRGSSGVGSVHSTTKSARALLLILFVVWNSSSDA